MENILYYVCVPFGALMRACWSLAGDYGLAILLFTLATKVVLLPLSVWIHKNSILMVKIQPEMNFIKARFYGDGDTIADEQSKLFKKHGYHPMLSLIPLAIQIGLLMAVICIIYDPLDYLFGVPSDVSNALGAFIGADLDNSGWQIQIVNAIRSGKITAVSSIEGVSPQTLAQICETVGAFDVTFFGFDLTAVPIGEWGKYTFVPLIAGVSAWGLCFTQNLSNVIQHEQSAWNKYGLMAISVGISLYLGCFVPVGIALYWTASNALSIAQMYALNAAIAPRKYVDYAALEKSREALRQIDSLDRDEDRARIRANRKRERKDYKRFFSIVNKHLVIYSEKSGFYKYFKGLIEELNKRSNVVVHYVTNDPDDVIFEVAKQNPRIKPYYIGIKRAIPLMMKLEADMVLMTTPDLNKMYLKRSIMKKDVEYVYVPHDTMSIHMGFREGALDEFDTVFCTGPHVEREIRATEAHYVLTAKRLVRFGYPLSDELMSASREQTTKANSDTRKTVLIAPSWQEDNLLDSCIDELIEGLWCDEYKIVVRPHPEYVKRYGARMRSIVDKYAERTGEGLEFQLDFSDNTSIYSSDVLITDWSGIAPEFCFATGRPAIFINTEMKCRNPNWRDIGIEPVEIGLRTKLGIALDKSELFDIKARVEELSERSEEYARRIEKTYGEHLFNHGSSAKEGARYILSRLVTKAEKGKEK